VTCSCFHFILYSLLHSYFVVCFIFITKIKWRGSVSTFHDVAQFHSFLTAADMNCRHPNNHSVQSTSVQVFSGSLVLPTFSLSILIFSFALFSSSDLFFVACRRRQSCCCSCYRLNFSPCLSSEWRDITLFQEEKEGIF